MRLYLGVDLGSTTSKAVLVDDGDRQPAQYFSRGAVDHNGDLFFGNVGTKPVGLFKVHLPTARKRKNAHLPIRMWG